MLSNCAVVYANDAKEMSRKSPRKSDMNARDVNQLSKKIPRRIYVNSSITSVLIATWKRIHSLLFFNKTKQLICWQRERLFSTPEGFLSLSLADIHVVYLVCGLVELTKQNELEDIQFGILHIHACAQMWGTSLI